MSPNFWLYSNLPQPFSNRFLSHLRHPCKRNAPPTFGMQMRSFPFIYSALWWKRSFMFREKVPWRLKSRGVDEKNDGTMVSSLGVCCGQRQLTITSVLFTFDVFLFQQMIQGICKPFDLPNLWMFSFDSLCICFHSAVSNNRPPFFLHFSSQTCYHYHKDLWHWNHCGSWGNYFFHNVLINIFLVNFIALFAFSVSIPDVGDRLGLLSGTLVAVTAYQSVINALIP